MENEVIKTLLAVESVIGVYRNYTLFSKKRKFLSVMRITIEMIISTALTVNNAILLVDNRNIRGEASVRLMFFYHLMVYLTSSALMVCGTVSSCHFEKFIQDFIVLDSSNKKNNTYLKKMRSKKMEFLVILTLSFITCVLFFILKIVSTVYWKKWALSYAFLFLILSESIAEIRFISEQLVFYTYIWMLHFVLKCLNEYLMDIHLKCKTSYSKMLGTGNTNDLITVEEVHEWALKYQRLVNCSKALSACFKFQVRYVLFLNAKMLKLNFSEVQYDLCTYTRACFKTDSHRDTDSRNFKSFGHIPASPACYTMVYVQLY